MTVSSLWYCYVQMGLNLQILHKLKVKGFIMFIHQQMLLYLSESCGNNLFSKSTWIFKILMAYRFLNYLNYKLKKDLKGQYLTHWGSQRLVSEVSGLARPSGSEGPLGCSCGHQQWPGSWWTTHTNKAQTENAYTAWEECETVCILLSDFYHFQTDKQTAIGLVWKKDDIWAEIEKMNSKKGKTTSSS